MNNLTARLHDRLRSSGFRLLAGAQHTVGPFAVRSGELHFVRLDCSSYATASIATVENDQDAVRVIEELNWDVVGHDLNLGHQAQFIDTLSELRFFVGGERPSSAGELAWRGYRRAGACWMKIDEAFPIPDLGDGFAGEIFPCVGWVPSPGETSEFGKAEQRRGFCSKVVPQKAQAIEDVRGYRFIHAGYAERPILRRQILVFLEDSCDPATSVDGALALIYGDA